MNATKTNSTADYVFKFIGIIFMILICYMGFVQKNESDANNRILSNMQKSIEKLNVDVNGFIIRNNEAHEKIKDKIDVNVAKIYEIKGSVQTYCTVTDNIIESLKKEIELIKNK